MGISFDIMQMVAVVRTLANSSSLFAAGPALFAIISGLVVADWYELCVLLRQPPGTIILRRNFPACWGVQCKLVTFEFQKLCTIFSAVC